MLLQKGSFYCNATKNPHVFFILLKKVLVCSIGHLQTHWKFFFGKIIYYYFLTSRKKVSFNNSFFWQYADVVKRILVILLSTLDLERIKVLGSLVFASPHFTLYIYLCFVCLGGGGTNERPGTDHVIWGPMRGLEKKMHPMAQTDRQTDMVTLWLNRPSAANSVKL